MSTVLHDNVLHGIINAAEELQLDKPRVEALKALVGAKSVNQAAEKLGIGSTAFTRRLWAIHNHITNSIKRLKQEQPIAGTRKPIHWPAFDTHSKNSLKSLSRTPEFFEDIVYLSYELPHVRNLSEVTYNKIAAVVLKEVGLKMPDWKTVTRKL